MKAPRLLTHTSKVSAQPQGVQKRLYTIQEAAIYLGRSVWGVRELIWKGELPSVRVGRRVHLDINDLDAWIEQNKVREVL